MPQTESAAFTAQFNADVPLRADLQTNTRQIRRTDAVETLARAQTRTQVEACGCVSLLSAFILLQLRLRSSSLGCISACVNRNITCLFSCDLQP